MGNKVFSKAPLVILASLSSGTLKRPHKSTINKLLEFHCLFLWISLEREK